MEKQKTPPVVADINVTPMVDMMLVLLIIFMVITPMLTHYKMYGPPRGVKQNLGEAGSSLQKCIRPTCGTSSWPR